LEYEELPVPNKLPNIIPSPANVLEWQAGDSFDFSIALCSLLIGCGYDAYCVYGTAPKEITTKDESLMDCPFSLEIDDPEDNEDPEKDEDEDEMIDKKQDGVKPSEDFSVPQKPPQLSKFDETLSAEEREAREAKWVRENTIDDD
jgi:hypothetical protein